MSQLQREQYARKWPSWVFNREEEPPSEEALQNLVDSSVHDAQALKKLTGINNAYLLLSRRCDNTIAASLLEACPQGDVATAFNNVWDYHYPRTQAGKQRAYKAFNQVSMANSRTTIVEWTAHVSRLASILRTCGGSADESAELCVLLEGLLPEFKDIKLHLEQTHGLSLVDARSRLISHASTAGLNDLRRGGKGTNTKVFIAREKKHGREDNKADSEKKNAICHHWARGMCHPQGWQL